MKILVEQYWIIILIHLLLRRLLKYKNIYKYDRWQKKGKIITMLILILGLVALITGIVMVWAPERIFEIYERWSWYSMRDSSDRYIAYICTRGVVLAIGGVLAIIAFFVS